MLVQRSAFVKQRGRMRNLWKVVGLVLGPHGFLSRYAPALGEVCPANASRSPGYELVQGTLFFLRENETQIDIDKGAEFSNSLLTAMQPHAYTWWNTHFQVNCFLGRSIPLENGTTGYVQRM